MTGVSSDPCGMARSACGGAAGSVARVSVSRGEASGSRPARAGFPRGSIDTRGTRKGNRLQGRAEYKGAGETQTQIARPGPSRERHCQ